MRQLSSLVLLGLALAACTPAEPVRFYALTPIADAVPQGETELVVGVLPINLAAYLDRSGIVVRTSPNELAISAQHNWVEPLDTQARRVVARNLAELLGTDRVFVLPEQRLLPLDYAVEIAVERFEIVGAQEAPGEASPALLMPPEEALLEARWTLFAGEDRRVLRTAFERLAVPIEPPAGFEQRVAALSDALGRLTRSVATEIAASRS
jgi:uncharacterized protein